METALLAPTSFPNESPMGTQTRIEAQPSGEFSKVLQNQSAQADNSDETPPEGQEEKQQSATAEEISPLMLSSLPALLPEGQSPLGGNEFATTSPASQDLGNNGGGQTFPVPTPVGGTRDGSTAVLQQKRINEDSSSAGDKSFNLRLSTAEGILPVDLPAEIPTSEKGQVSSLPAEKSRINNLERQFWQHSDGVENALGDLKNSAKAELAKFESGFLIKEEDFLQNDLNFTDISKMGNPKNGELLGNPTAPVDGSAAPRAGGEIRFEGYSGPSQPQKPEVYEQVSQKMLWSFSQNEEKFRLILDPPHLGSIYMEIHRDKEQVKATLWAENPQAKQILESNQISIQKIIESEGFYLESFNVFVEQDLGAFQESRERMNNPEGKPSDSAAETNRAPGGDSNFASLSPQIIRGRYQAIDLII
jgi:flagellar hook-length control protein FliK